MPTAATSPVDVPRFDDQDDSHLGTLPQFLRRNAVRFPDTIAYRERTESGWDETPWSKVFDDVRDLAAGILDLVGDPGAVGQMPVGYVIGANSPEFFMCEYAVQSIGATAFPLFERMTAPEMRATLSTYNAVIAFSGSRDATDRLIDAADDLRLSTIVQWGNEQRPDDDRVLSVDNLRERGRSLLTGQPHAVDALIDQGEIDDIGCVLLTSGTTGTSKGVLGSYRYLLDIAGRYRFVYRAERGDCYLSYLPAPFTPEQYCGMTMAAALPLQVAFPASAASIEEDFVESGATMRYLGPRQWEELRATLSSELLDDPRRITAEKESIRRQLGLEHMKAGVTAGGSMSSDVVEFFRSIDLPISNVYGFAEVGIITAAGPEHPSDSVGFPLPSAYGDPIELRISPAGELQLRGGVRCSGYWGGKHTLKITDDMWLRSGDAGELVAGALRILERLENIQTLPDGTVFAPQTAEVRVTESPYIANVLLIGGHEADSRIAALVQLNEAAVRRDLGLCEDASYRDIVLDARTLRMLRRELAVANDSLPESQRIRIVGLMPKPLTSDDGELTRSMKLRRTEVLRRYDAMVERLYGLRDTGEEIITFEAIVGRETDAAPARFTTQVSLL